MLSTIYWWSTVHEIEDLNPYLGTGWTVKMVRLIWGNILIHPTQKWPIVWSILTVHSKRLGCDCVTLTHTVWIGRGRGKGVWRMSVWRLRWISGSWTFSKKKKKKQGWIGGRGFWFESYDAVWAPWDTLTSNSVGVLWNCFEG